MFEEENDYECDPNAAWDNPEEEDYQDGQFGD